MVGDMEPDGVSRRSPGFGERSLEARRRGHVLHRTTRSADEMVVVMAGQVLRQLEATVLVDPLNAAHDARLSEHGEVPVRRALRHTGRGRQEFGHRQWAIGGGQRFDQLLALRGVPLIGTTEP